MSSPQAVIAAVNRWQANKRQPLLTCGFDSGHRLLVPVQDGDGVALRCLECDFVQVKVPPEVLEWDVRRRRRFHVRPSIGDLARIVSTAVGLVSLYIAVQSFQHAVAIGTQQLSDADEQASILSAHRDALQASSVALTAQLAILEAQREEELRRAAQRPALEMDIRLSDKRSIPWPVERKDPLELEMAGGQTEVTLTFAFRNVGDAVLLMPLVNITAAPTGVRACRTLVSPINWGPISMTKVPFVYECQLTVPETVNVFALGVSVLGDNLSRQVFGIPIRVRRQP